MFFSINTIFLYSLLGFVLESVVYKYYQSDKHSSIFYGPYTLVYGFGMYFCLLTYNILNNYLPNHFLIYLLYFLLFMIITTLTEFIAGHLIHHFLKIDKWDYTNHKIHFGKYICLDYSFYWGIISLFTTLFLNPFLERNIITKIPSYTTYILLFIFIVDLSLIIKNKIIKK